MKCLRFPSYFMLMDLTADPFVSFGVVSLTFSFLILKKLNQLPQVGESIFKFFTKSDGVYAKLIYL